jgi:hypothetical protein
MFANWSVYVHTNELETHLLWQCGRTYSQRFIHNKTDNNTTSNSYDLCKMHNTHTVEGMMHKLVRNKILKQIPFK